MSIAEAYSLLVEDVGRLALACGRNPADVAIVAASKMQTIEAIQEAYGAGCRLFGESHIQEATEKLLFGPRDIQWHLIGSLQRKKVSKVIGRFALIHSVDTVELAQALSKASMDRGVITRILLEANTSGEAAKHGLTCQQWLATVKDILELPGLDVQGFMAMAPLTDDTALIRRCFCALRQLKEQVEHRWGRPLPHLSMGMSHDYPIAIQEGATLVRVGTAIFGKR